MDCIKLVGNRTGFTSTDFNTEQMRTMHCMRCDILGVPERYASNTWFGPLTTRARRN